jgi:hypothetical protein
MAFVTLYADEPAGEHVRTIAARLAKEARITGKVEYTEIAHTPGRDERTWWQRFVQSRELLRPTRTLELDVPLSPRALTLSVHTAPDPRLNRLHCVGLSMRVTSKVGGDVVYRRSTDRFDGGALATLLDGDAELKKILRTLLVTRSHPVSISDAMFALEPGHLMAHTLPQETWGGFAYRIGIDLFLEAALRAEALAMAHAVMR